MGHCGIIILFMTCIIQQTLGADRVDARLLLQHVLQRRQRATEYLTPYGFKRDAVSLPLNKMNDALSLDAGSELDVVKTSTTVQGTNIIKMQEFYKGRVVPDGVLTLETDSAGLEVLDASGAVYRNINLKEGESEGDDERALTVCLRNNSDEAHRDQITRIKVEKEVLFDDERNAFPACLVQYLVTEEGEVRRPTCILDERDFHVITAWDALDTCTDCSATGTGGNLVTGKIRYGELQRCLDLRKENGVCYLENKYVRVINNNFTRNETKEGNEDDTEVASYNCEEMDDEVNGGYSPLLDALFHGTVVGKMFEDWYNITHPLGDTMIFRVHFRQNYGNAFWNGYECIFGDGGEKYHPLVNLDTVGHEVGHGLTEKNSNLYYYQQWGGINEAFSDMMGEAAEAYLNTAADWMSGLEVSKEGVPPLRYFDDPQKDNASISHADNYTYYLDPHYGSGVYNRAFYLLVHEYGLPIKEAFHVFLHANHMYWHHMSNYVMAACDVMKAAYDRGQDGSKFRKAFDMVGVETCDIEEHVLGVRNKEPYNNIQVSKDITPTFIFVVEGLFAESVFVNASSSQGEVYILLSNKTWGSEEEEEDVDIYAEGVQSVQFNVPGNNTLYVSITLSTQTPTPLTDVTLLAGFICLKDFPIPIEDSQKKRILKCNLEEEGGGEEGGEEEEGGEAGGEGEGGQEEEGGEEGGGEEGGEEEGGEEEGGEGEGGGDTAEDDKEEGSDKEEQEEESSKTTTTGHVFNFFKSIVIMVFPQTA